MKRSIISEKAFAFSLKAMTFYKSSYSASHLFLLKQFIRSATSIGANTREASAAESSKDFIHKMSIASKEARETLYWIELFIQSQHFKADEKLAADLCKDCVELCKILTAIINTSKKRLKEH